MPKWQQSLQGASLVFSQQGEGEFVPECFCNFANVTFVFTLLFARELFRVVCFSLFFAPLASQGAGPFFVFALFSFSLTLLFDASVGVPRKACLCTFISTGCIFFLPLPSFTLPLMELAQQRSLGQLSLSSTLFLFCFSLLLTCPATFF